MPLKMLPSDPTFRAHACSVAYQITAMVNSADDSALLEALVRKNALAHTTRPGVYPQHFDILASVIMKVLQSKKEKTRLTPAAVTAWKKLFEFMLAVTSNVYQKEAIQAAGPQNTTSHSDVSLEEGMSVYETCMTDDNSLTTVDRVRKASTSEPTPHFRGTWLARSKAITRQIRGSLRTEAAHVKRKGPIAGCRKEMYLPQPRCPTPQDTSVASKSSYVAPNESLTSKNTDSDVTRDGPSDSGKYSVHPLAPSIVNDAAGAACTNPEIGNFDTGMSVALTDDTSTIPHVSAVSSNELGTYKRLVVVDATRGNISASDTTKPSLDYVSAAAQPVTDGRTREAASSGSADLDAMQNT
ncbi:uncharacterized protein [Dermacentor andersoni]